MNNRDIYIVMISMYSHTQNFLEVKVFFSKVSCSQISVDYSLDQFLTTTYFSACHEGDGWLWKEPYGSILQGWI